MKRLIVAVSLAVLASSALAVEIGKPFEQIDIDRAVPNLQIGDRTRFAAAPGSRSDLEIASEEKDATSPWANDQHFIAPPQ